MHEDQWVLGGDVGVDIHRLGGEEAIDQLIDLDARQSGIPGRLDGSTWAPLGCVWATAVLRELWLCLKTTCHRKTTTSSCQ